MNRPPKRTHSSPRSSDEHMQRRSDAGVSVRKIAQEFAVSKSTVHRRLVKGRNND